MDSLFSIVRVGAPIRVLKTKKSTTQGAYREREGVCAETEGGYMGNVRGGRVPHAATRAPGSRPVVVASASNATEQPTPASVQIDASEQRVATKAIEPASGAAMAAVGMAVVGLAAEGIGGGGAAAEHSHGRRVPH